MAAKEKVIADAAAAKEKAEAEAAAAKAKAEAEVAAAKAKAEAEVAAAKAKAYREEMRKYREMKAERVRALQEKEWSRGYRWTAYLSIIGFPLGLHRFVLSRISGIFYPICFFFVPPISSTSMLAVLPLIIFGVLFYDLFMIPKWSREKARKVQEARKKPWWG